MRQQFLVHAVLAATLLVAPACGRSNDDSGGNHPDATATEGAARVTNGMDTADAQRQQSPARPEDRVTGTAGTTPPPSRADEANGAGPDAVITMKIQAKYAGDDVVKGRNIDVDTLNGVVTLKGSVDTLRERDAAEQLARETDAVKRVVNDLKVAPRP